MDLDDLPENTYDLGDKKEKKENEKINSEEEEESKEEKFERIIREQSLKNKILRYKISFSKYLVAYDYRIQELDMLDIDQLEKLLTEIEICVSCRTSGNMLSDYYISTVSIVERVAPLLSMNLTGLSKVLGEDDRVRECLEEISIKYDVVQHTPPEARLAYLTLRSIMALNQHNKKVFETQKILDTKVKREVIDEFADL